MRVQGTASNSVEVNQERLLGGGDVQLVLFQLELGWEKNSRTDSKPSQDGRNEAFRHF